MADLAAIKERLESNEDVVENLESLNALLINNSASLVSDVLSGISLPLLFSCLQTDDQEQLQLTCAVLDKLLFHLPASDMVKHGHFMELGLQYPEAKVAKTCLQALLRLSGEGSIQELILAPTMLHLITQLLGGEDLQSASLATKLLLQFSIQGEILEGKLADRWLAELGQLLGLNDMVRYRVFDLLVQTCLEGGPKCFTIVEGSGYLNKLVAELDTSDPLVKMNCIELLSSLTETSKGVNFVHANHVLETLHQSLTTSVHDVMSAVVIPAILKFFGRLCLSLDSDAVVVCSQYPQFLELTLEAALTPQEETLWGVAVDTFGLLSSSLSGRTLLLTKHQSTSKVLERLGELINGAPTPVRCRALRCVKMMVSCMEECSWEHSMSRQLLMEIHPRALQLLLSVGRQPFADLRLAGLAVILGMAAWEWGQREMQVCPGFLEYLLDRKSEPDKEGKELKYAIVHRIVSTECGEVVWGNVHMMKMKIYDREGPFHYVGDTTVAIEGT